MTIRNFGNAAVSDEINRTGSNASALRGVSYPDGLPVLDFLSRDSASTDSNWVQQHEDQLQNVQHHEVVVLDGGHYLHWTQSKAIAEKITAFLGVDPGRP
jgi:pimeloyl-ACP methyl ester carboxylesterase